jgi:hypothetical protein
MQPFQPYDLTRSPPKPLKLRKALKNEKSISELLEEKKIDLKALLL